MPELDSPAAVRFGVFEFDPATGDLSKAGRRLKLQDQPAQVLALLVSRHGALVTRDELRAVLWRDDTFVDFDTGLNVVINKLRQALGDSATSPRFIETLPKKGYRFIAPLVPAAGPPHPAEARAPHRVYRGASPIAAMALLLASAAGIWMWRTPPPPEIRTLAVLPLENLSGNTADDYFAEGITDALITDLASIHAVTVIARQSTKQYKASAKPVSAIARELGGVDAVIEGSVLRTGTRVRLIVQLIDARTDRHLWARTYEQDLRDVLQLQREAARTIAGEIRAALTPAERARLEDARPVNPAAHDAYLRGRYLLDGRPEEEANSLEALAQFERAIELDPALAPAYVGVALVQERRGSTLGGRPPLDTRRLAFRAARRAIALDDGNAEAYDVLARLQMSEFDWPGADRSFARMFELSSASPRGLIWYSYRLLQQGRDDEAVETAKRAEALDRLNLNTRVMTSFVLSLARQYDPAIRNLREVLALAPDHLNARSFLIQWLASVGQHDEALAQADAMIDRFGRRPLTLPRLAFAQGRAGHRDAAERTIAELIQLSHREYVSPGQIAIAYAGLGDRDRTFEWLDLAYDERAVMMIFFPIEPMFQWPDDPRYGLLVEKIRLPHAAREEP